MMNPSTINSSMSYDEALAKVEQIVRDLEQSDAISVTDYRKKAEEAKRLLDFCEGEIKEIEKQLA